VSFLNSTIRDQKLKIGFPLAYSEPVALVAPLDGGQPQVQDTTPKLQEVILAARTDLSDAESRELEDLFTEYGNIYGQR
jgi:hypothetical protein